MATYDLTSLSDEEFVVHFGGRPREVDVYTFTNAMVGIADALREINAVVNPGQSLEIKIDAIGEGSFRTRIKTIKRRLPQMLWGTAKNVVLPLLLTFVYDKYLSDREDLRVEVTDERVVINRGKDKIIISRQAYDHKHQIDDNPKVADGVRRTLEAVQENSSVESIAFIENFEVKKPKLILPRAGFDQVLDRIAAVPVAVEGDLRTLPKRTLVVVLKAVFERSHRKWQFIWHGIRISASISDGTFFDRLERREFAIAQGDALDVDLEITQALDARLGVWENRSYEVTKVYDIIKGPHQSSFDDDAIE
jgi:hypothetical protein